MVQWLRSLKFGYDAEASSVAPPKGVATQRVVSAVFLLLGLFAVANPAHAALTINSSIVKSGYFKAPDCTPEADPKRFNECLCEANIRKAVAVGLPEAVNAQVNANLALLPEKLAAESCEGEPSTPPTAGLKLNLASADYAVAYQSDDILTVLVTYATYGAGSEHPLEGTEGFTLDLKTGHTIDPIARLKPDQLQKADAFIKQELLRKYPQALYEEVKARAEPFLTESGCDTCTIFYSAEGWKVRFQLAAVAPYMTGEPEVTVPVDIIPSPEHLSVRN